MIFFVICFSNGHLQNICTTMIVKKFSKERRAAVYVLAYFFTQFGKFLFALIIYNYNDSIIQGKLAVTVYPIIILIIAQIVVNLILINSINEKIKFKQQIFINVKSDTGINSISTSDSSKNNLVNLIENISNTNKTELRELRETKIKTTLQIFTLPMKQLLCPRLRNHSFNLIFLNLSLGIQFFSMINVFPHLNNKNIFTLLVDEIFFSKTLHTIFLFFLPFLFLWKEVTRKTLLFTTFTLNLFLNFLTVLNLFNSSIFIHMFRFIWNVSFITINLYCAEAITKNLRGVNTSVMYLIFKISCVIEILAIDKFISFSLYLPILFNILIIIGNMFLVSKLDIETHMKSLDEIDEEINSNIDKQI